MDKRKEFAVRLFHIGAIKFGHYTTKIGLKTPFYCDLRLIVSYPKLLESLSTIVKNLMEDLPVLDLICGVPYTALPIATMVSVKNDIPMVMRRKEAKSYGTQNKIEGIYKEANTCLIIEDVVTSGSSIVETATDLRNAGIQCEHAIVVLNREQGGDALLKKHGIQMHALFNLTQLLQYLREENCITSDTVKEIITYVQETQISGLPQAIDNTSLNRLKLSYMERSKYCSNPVAQKLFQIMHEKETNLCFAPDVTHTSELFRLIEETGSEICMLKMHVDILEDFTAETISTLQKLAKQYNFLIMEDRKFADIGKIVKMQYEGGLYKISSWADAITAHSLSGNGLLMGINKSQGSDKKGVFLVAQMSSACNLIDKTYTTTTIKQAEEYPEVMCGFVCQSPLFLDKPGLVHLIPGVRLEITGDSLGQQYNSPEDAILKLGGDLAVVGGAITEAIHPKQTAKQYRHLLFDSYKKRLF